VRQRDGSSAPQAGAGGSSLVVVGIVVVFKVVFEVVVGLAVFG
jgi:hypothetical protein